MTAPNPCYGCRRINFKANYPFKNKMFPMWKNWAHSLQIKAKEKMQNFDTVKALLTTQNLNEAQKKG